MRERRRRGPLRGARRRSGTAGSAALFGVSPMTARLSPRAGALALALAAACAPAIGTAANATPVTAQDYQHMVRAEAGRVSVSVFATGLNNPRGLKVGPDGLMYVAEGGVGGT